MKERESISNIYECPDVWVLTSNARTNFCPWISHLFHIFVSEYQMSSRTFIYYKKADSFPPRFVFCDIHLSGRRRVISRCLFTNILRQIFVAFYQQNTPVRRRALKISQTSYSSPSLITYLNGTALQYTQSTGISPSCVSRSLARSQYRLDGAISRK